MNLPSEETVLYYRVARKDLVFLKFILEAYEGMSTMSTVDNRAGIVRISIPDGFVADMKGLLDSLSRDILLEPTVFAPPAS